MDRKPRARMNPKTVFTTSSFSLWPQDREGNECFSRIRFSGGADRIPPSS
jgi:hypothetical protein